MGQRRRYVRQSPPRTYDPGELRYFVYRLSDAEGRALYVGRSDNPEGRLRTHRASTDWAKAVVLLETWGPYTWADVVTKERERIEAEQPLHNRMHVARP